MNGVRLWSLAAPAPRGWIYPGDQEKKKIKKKKINPTRFNILGDHVSLKALEGDVDQPPGGATEGENEQGKKNKPHTKILSDLLSPTDHVR